MKEIKGNNLNILLTTVTSKLIGSERLTVKTGKDIASLVFTGPREPVSTDEESINNEEKLLNFSLLM